MLLKTISMDFKIKFVQIRIVFIKNMYVNLD